MLPRYEQYEKLRDERGDTDAKVARAIEINSSVLSHWKAKDYAPKVDKISKLASYFGVSLAYFYEEPS